MSRMSNKEFIEWQLFYNIDPFGDQRADLRMGILASAVLAPHMEKDKTAPTPSEFMPFLDANETPEQDQEQETTETTTQKVVPLSGKIGAAVAKRMFKHIQGKK